MFRQGPDFHFKISEVEIARVNCNSSGSALFAYIILLDTFVIEMLGHLMYKKTTNVYL